MLVQLVFRYIRRIFTKEIQKRMYLSAKFVVYACITNTNTIYIGLYTRIVESSFNGDHFI